jgi:nitrite reductase/ring-hydroxylating ferredoxin subunit
MCHAHGARFHPLSGECTLGACLGQGLRPVPMRVDNAGGIQVDMGDGPPLPTPAPTH